MQKTTMMIKRECDYDQIQSSDLCGTKFCCGEGGKTCIVLIINHSTDGYKIFGAISTQPPGVGNTPHGKMD